MTSRLSDLWVSLRGSFHRWLRLAGWPGILSALMSLATLAGFSLLYRGLPLPDAGTLALVISLSDIVGLLALVGLGTVVTRLYASSGAGVYNWPLDLGGTAAYAVPLIVVTTWGLCRLYSFPAWIGLYLFGLTALGALLSAAYAMLNSQGHYAWSAFLIRAPNTALLLPGLATLWVPVGPRLDFSLAVALGATLLCLLAGVAILVRTLPRGPRRISARQRAEGLAFMVTNATDMLSDQGLIAVAGKVLVMSQVAAFAAVAILLRPFRLVRGILSMILAPDLLRFRRTSYVRLMAGVWGAAAVCGVATAIVIPPLATRFYGGRYPEAMSWIPYLALAGVLLIGCMPARTDLSVRAPIGTMNRFAVVYLASMLIVLGLGVTGMATTGAIFLALTVVLLEVTEVGVSYGFWFRFRRGERSLFGGQEPAPSSGPVAQP